MGTDRAHSDINSQKALLLGLALPQQIIAALAKHDAEVRFCGGVVRDIMIGQLKWPEPDIDMASPMPPKMAANILKAAGLRVIPTGIAHGTITVMLPSDPACKVELTTLRSDHKTDGRHAEVRFIEDWHADASRRDFTCNSLYMTASGVVIDPFGGLDDLDAGIVRFIGNPNDRIAEDVLRIFRFFRFYARFGRADIEPATATALTNAASDIQSLSGERIASELIKTFSYRSLKTITMMDNLGIWRALTGEQIYIDDYAALLDLDIEHNAMMALAVLIPPAVCDGLARRLKIVTERHAIAGTDAHATIG
jgi:poly(A) polymerase